MVRRLFLSVALVCLGAAIGAGGQSWATAKLLFHPGSVVDAKSGAPLEASVAAWPDDKRQRLNGECPAYGDKALDIEISGAGQFRILVDEQQAIYTVVYCRNGYMPRVDFNLKSPSGTPVVPARARLWTAQISNDDDAARFDNEVAANVIGALNNLFYLRSVDRTRFESEFGAIEKLLDYSKDRASAVHAVQEAASRWSGGSAE